MENRLDKNLSEKWMLNISKIHFLFIFFDLFYNIWLPTKKKDRTRFLMAITSKPYQKLNLYYILIPHL